MSYVDRDGQRQLLVEFFPLNYDYTSLITEAAKSPTSTMVLKSVILQRANAENQNKRIYPKEILLRESDKYQKEFVSQRRALAELDHPDSPIVNLKNASHIVSEMHWEGDDLVGTVEILTTPAGNIVKELLRNNIRIGISSRGLGSLSENSNGLMSVGEDFSLICFDIVSNPSTHGAFINKPLQESVDAGNRIQKLAKEELNMKIDTLVRDFFSVL